MPTLYVRVHPEIWTLKGSSQQATHGARQRYTPLTTTMLILEEPVRISSRAVYSGEFSQAWTWSMLLNSSKAMRSGAQAPDTISMPPPRATNLPP